MHQVFKSLLECLCERSFKVFAKVFKPCFNNEVSHSSKHLPISFPPLNTCFKPIPTRNKMLFEDLNPIPVNRMRRNHLQSGVSFLHVKDR